MVVEELYNWANDNFIRDLIGAFVAVIALMSLLAKFIYTWVTHNDNN